MKTRYLTSRIKAGGEPGFENNGLNPSGDCHKHSHAPPMPGLFESIRRFFAAETELAPPRRPRQPAGMSVVAGKRRHRGNLIGAGVDWAAVERAAKAPRRKKHRRMSVEEIMVLMRRMVDEPDPEKAEKLKIQIEDGFYGS
jgi:hypothetical protein